MKKNDKKNEPGNKDIVAEIKEEFKHHTNILMEQMRHEVKTVAEGHGVIIRKLEKHDEKFEQIEHKLEDHDRKFAKIESDIVEVKTDLHAIKSELHSMSMALMETSHETKDHEKRVKKLEEKALI